jgi:hypothetical protein
MAETGRARHALTSDCLCTNGDFGRRFFFGACTGVETGEMRSVRFALRKIKYAESGTTDIRQAILFGQ